MPVLWEEDVTEPMIEPMTDRWIQEQLALCEAAPPGPWTWGFADFAVQLGNEGIVSEKDLVFVNSGRVSGEPAPETISFILAARMGYPVVLKALREAREHLKHIKELEKVLAEFVDEVPDFKCTYTGCMKHGPERERVARAKALLEEET